MLKRKDEFIQSGHERMEETFARAQEKQRLRQLIRYLKEHGDPEDD